MRGCSGPVLAGRETGKRAEIVNEVRLDRSSRMPAQPAPTPCLPCALPRDEPVPIPAGAAYAAETFGVRPTCRRNSSMKRRELNPTRSVVTAMLSGMRRKGNAPPGRNCYSDDALLLVGINNEAVATSPRQHRCALTGKAGKILRVIDPDRLVPKRNALGTGRL